MAKQTPYRMTSLVDIKPYARNPRIIPQAAVDAVARSIQAFGFRQPIVVDKNGVILAGHTRYKAAQQLGLAEVPVIWQTDITEIQARGYRIADNKVAELSAWDRDALDLEVRELADLGDTDLDALGLADWELERILADDSGSVGLPEDCTSRHSQAYDTQSVEEPPVADKRFAAESSGGVKYFSTRKGLTYAPTDNPPKSLNDCMDDSRYREALSAIESLSGLTEAERIFFDLAATRLVQFNYTRLAQYYASTDSADVVKAMELLTLVIPDMDRAIQNGLALLEETLLELSQEDASDAG